MITNVSFDLWLTLIKSHPLFKKRRAELIVDKYNPQGLTSSRIEDVTRECDKIFDRYNEMTGKKIPASEMYLKVIRKVGFDSGDIKMKDAKRLEEESNVLFLEYMPELLNNDIHQTLSKLVENGLSLNVASNTGYIESQTLRKALQKMDLLKYFSFQIFSDEVNASKPSPIFFQEVLNNARVNKNQILHVGDNAKTDYKGASNFGFSAFLITNNNYTFDDIARRL